jgi:hypothetical protein
MGAFAASDVLQWPVQSVLCTAFKFGLDFRDPSSAWNVDVAHTSISQTSNETLRLPEPSN